MDLNFSAFQEPRGVMRILHFVFSICAFATITGYSGHAIYKCDEEYKFEFDYPFNLQLDQTLKLKSGIANCTIALSTNFSSDAKFFVATGVLAMLYSIAIMIVYVKMDEKYKTNNQLPLIDFVLTVIFGVLWLSSSAAWANGLTGVKNVLDNSLGTNCSTCSLTQSSYSTLNISVIFGFLNFFLWAADLWFLYKETVWFQNTQPQTTSGV